ncbi:MAG TPA: hypothetical protein VFX70_09445 [Mycobacteriales bacterium]|nr:hypothetical protein [Mycobacteriales bacterium]
MSVLQIVLIYGVIPAGFIALIALLIFVPSAARTPRYRPGRPWPYAPVWYLPHPAAERSAGPGDRGALVPGVRPGELAARAGAPASVLDEVATAKGGAHGSW